MNDPQTTNWLGLYRKTVADAHTPELDDIILAAATKQSYRRRRNRHAKQLLLIGAFGVIAFATIWYVRQPPSYGQLSGTGYGSVEGISRSYLLSVRLNEIANAGSVEGTAQ